MTNGSGEKDLQTLLRSMEPTLEVGEWVFVTTDAAPASVAPLATFREAEGLSLLISRADADSAGLSYDFVGSWISLTVHSALDAVGLTAAIATRLTEANISCNVIAARHHDHIVVGVEDADEALSQIKGLAASS
ncbi:ACT domain-containing protein [Ornithinimicrobium sp. Arc0846-15]|nr:ACT domain-containing protein [Ornithinimicrobium laminariae]